jgi:hypothetical protein
MYSADERERVRADLINAARADPRVSGIALTGSASIGREDHWSDIDLAFGIDQASQIEPAVVDYTTRMHEQHGAVDQLDVRRDTWLYRVFLLSSGLQVDLAFAPQGDFGARAPTFRLLSGRAAEPPHMQPPAAEQLIAFAWLYALHVRSAVARGKLWQAEYMVHAVRDYVLAAACRRHEAPAVEGRGMDQLPDAVSRPLRQALVTRLEAHEIVRAFGVVVDCLIHEAEQTDASLAARLTPVLRDLLETTRASIGSRPTA